MDNFDGTCYTCRKTYYDEDRHKTCCEITDEPIIVWHEKCTCVDGYLADLAEELPEGYVITKVAENA